MSRTDINSSFNDCEIGRNTTGIPQHQLHDFTESLIQVETSQQKDIILLYRQRQQSTDYTVEVGLDAMSTESETNSLAANTSQAAIDNDEEYIVESVHWIYPELPTVLDEQGIKELPLPATEMNFFSVCHQSPSTI